MKNLRQKIVIIFVVVLLLAYTATYFWLKNNFHAFAFPKILETPTYFFSEKMKQFGLDYEKIALSTDYGNVEACIIPSKSQNNIWLLYLQNTDKLYYSEKNLWRYRVWNYLGMNVIVPNYIRNEQAQIENPEKLYQTALVAYNYLIDKLEVPSERVLFYGEGVGTYPVIRLANEMNVAGVVVENGFMSLQSYLQDLFPVIKVNWITPDWLNIKDYITQIDKPILFFNSLKDETYPFRHTQMLYEKTTSEQKKIITLKKNLQQIKEKDGKTYQKALSDFLKELKLRNL
ncbi:MAG: alpha/beta hydrolase [Raineya sp.]|nr:alpha/beta hydrolase [Raineya sp.]